MRKKILFVLPALAAALMFYSPAGAHCQIPCGIYDDDMRMKMMAEHITTIEKSMRLIKELSEEEEKDYNQIVRWVNNKEEHAQQLSDIITYYYMAQRIKPAEESDKKAFEKYQTQLTLLHKMLVETMKTKQTTDFKHIENLRELLHEFGHAYGGHEH
ncbi:superoxide dismutase [Ni] [Sedimentisphaera salicampi]|uniref:Superoxide dismutase, Ni n=1 Tax=Sedimentisphaera salicampi TaxID=1941349 RepID=A0A1W6LLC8_9BACT|nr:superoxide dismutase [Ni] [Sedimentisphaera salicampi]ARN56553.1 superoxide dismutase, Ni [Sedimentisphaera salicampi]OXU15438.1 superoxide dismutase, Ni [Sedimentisphaera salicampi]